jgi:transcriptional regulator with GAF, ATPase, and Fis domain
MSLERLMSFTPHDAATFARISQELLAEPAVEQTLERVVELAVAGIEGCDMVGLTMRHGKKVDTPAATDPIVLELDHAQYDLQQGPCLDAVWVDDTYVIEDMTTETRWPRWTPRAAELGVMSVLSVRLSTPAEVVGGLNLYSRKGGAYDEDAIQAAHIYAAHASNAIAALSNATGLMTAMQSRHSIGMAQGLLMLRYGLSEEQAFAFMVRYSQDENIKLREIAARVVNQFKAHGELP